MVRRGAAHRRTARRAKPRLRTPNLQRKSEPSSPSATPALSPAGRLGAADDRTAVWAAALGALTVAAAGAFLAVKLNIWMDEAFTLSTTGAGVAAAWTRAIGFEAQPPLYFVIEAAWRLLDESSPAFARVPSVVFAALAVAVIVDAAHRIAPRFPPALAALLTAGNPLFIWAASEMRVYALVLLIGAVLTALFFEAFLAPAPRRRAKVWYAVVALAGLYTQYYVGFVLAAHFLTLLMLRRDRLRSFAASMLPVAAGFAPFVGIAFGHVAQSGAFVSRSTPLGAIHEVANVVFEIVLPHDVNWGGAAKLGGFVAAAGLAAGIAAWGRPRVEDGAERAVVLQWLIAVAVFMLLFSVSGVPVALLRHLVVLAPATLIVVCILLSGATRHRVAVTASAALVFATFAGGDFYSEYKPPPAKRGDWQRVAALLANAPGKSTPIAVFPAEVALPLGVYLKMPVLPIPRPMPLRVDYVGATTLTGEADAARVLGPVRARSPRLWLVTTRTCSTTAAAAYDYNCRYLEAYLARYYHLRESVPFSGSMVRLYERNSVAGAL